MNRLTTCPAAAVPAAGASVSGPASAAGGGSLTVDAELLADGFRTLQDTGVHGGASIGF